MTLYSTAAVLQNTLFLLLIIYFFHDHFNCRLFSGNLLYCRRVFFTHVCWLHLANVAIKLMLSNLSGLKQFEENAVLVRLYLEKNTPILKLLTSCVNFSVSKYQVKLTRTVIHYGHLSLLYVHVCACKNMHISGNLIHLMVLKYIIVFLVKIQENNNLTRCKIDKNCIYIKNTFHIDAYI